MLELLRVRNFAIITFVELEFSKGLNVITGETGAGKSILLEAVGLILGNRADTGVIRAGCDEAVVEAQFRFAFDDGVVPALAMLETLGFPPSDDLLLIKRIVHRSGRNKIYINGELATLQQLAAVSENLVDLCSQHENQSLVKSNYQLDLIDRYGGLLEMRRSLSDLVHQHRALEERRRELEGPHKKSSYGVHNDRATDFINFQISEIDNFQLAVGEEDKLQLERRRLMNLSQIIDGLAYAQANLNSEHDGHSNLLAILKKIENKLLKLLPVEKSFEKILTPIQQAKLYIEEAIYSLDELSNSFNDDLESVPSQLHEIEMRLGRYADMKRKYGDSVEEILQYRASLELELSEAAQASTRLQEIEGEIKLLFEKYCDVAQKLSKKRRAVIKTLATSVNSELRQLMMPSAEFVVSHASVLPSLTDGWSADGIDSVSYLFSANKGEDLRPISKVASGGELSRITLALRRTIADKGRLGVYLFDEIDAGIGGKTATVVGRKLRSVSQYNQVICITHLPQVAAFAETHFSIEKHEHDNRTQSEIRRLADESERVQELARMLGVASKQRSSAKLLAKEMLQASCVN